MSAPAIDFVVPAGIDDPTHPSGGNHYDRRVIASLSDRGRVVREHPVAGPEDIDTILADLPDDSVAVVDGLLASAAPTAIGSAADRSTVVVLLHMPFAEASPDPAVRRAERAALAAAALVATTSDWARDWVIRHHRLPPERVRVAAPGVDPGPVAEPSPAGGRMLCLAAVTQAKGHDTLVSALAQLADLDWYCSCVGALDLEPGFVAGLRETMVRSGIADRVELVGPLVDDALDVRFAGTDLLVSASRRESYGMAVAEALARAVPVVATDVGGHREAVGRAPGGVLVPPDDPDLLAEALRSWLTDHDERDRLRAAALRRRDSLSAWSETARRLAEAVDAVAPDPIGVRR